MPQTVIPLSKPVLLPIAGETARFPVRRVYCVGRNYAEHAREMGHDPQAEPPFFFQKNPDNLDSSGRFPYPALSQDVHHEVELAVLLQAGGQDIALDQAMGCVWGYAVALDMTRRDLQGQLKKQGRSWEMAKAFEASAPIGPALAASALAGPDALDQAAITLSVNGSLRQAGKIRDMIWSVPAIIADLSRYVALAPGDVILTGTPAGVAAVARGDVLQARIEGLPPLDVAVI